MITRTDKELEEAEEEDLTHDECDAEDRVPIPISYQDNETVQILDGEESVMSPQKVPHLHEQVPAESLSASVAGEQCEIVEKQLDFDQHEETLDGNIPLTQPASEGEATAGKEAAASSAALQEFIGSEEETTTKSKSTKITKGTFKAGQKV